MAYTDAARNLMLDELASVAVYVSAHTGDPGESGDNEVSGGSPAYARQSISWDSAADGELVATSQPVFDIPAGTTVTHIGLWSADTGGTFYGYGEVVAEAFGAQGTYTLTESVLDLLA